MFDELINNFFLSHYKIILHKDPWCTPARACIYKPLQVSIYYAFLIISRTWCTFHNWNKRSVFCCCCQWHYTQRASSGNRFTCHLLPSTLTTWSKEPASLIPFSTSIPDASQLDSIPASPLPWASSWCSRSMSAAVILPKIQRKTKRFLSHHWTSHSTCFSF